MVEKKNWGVGQGQDVRWMQNIGNEGNWKDMFGGQKIMKIWPKILVPKKSHVCEEGQGRDGVGGKLEDRR